MSVDQGTGHHQGLPVAGYKPQNQRNVDLVNLNKQAEEAILRKLDEHKISGEIDQRWLAIARTHIEEAFMAWNRAIFKPTRVPLPGEDE